MDHFTTASCPSDVHLKIIRYPPSTTGDGQVGLHSDTGLDVHSPDESAVSRDRWEMISAPPSRYLMTQMLRPTGYLKATFVSPPAANESRSPTSSTLAELPFEQASRRTRAVAQGADHDGVGLRVEKQPQDPAVPHPTSPAATTPTWPGAPRRGSGRGHRSRRSERIQATPASRTGRAGHRARRRRRQHHDERAEKETQIRHQVNRRGTDPLRPPGEIDPEGRDNTRCYHSRRDQHAGMRRRWRVGKAEHHQSGLT